MPDPSTEPFGTCKPPLEPCVLFLIRPDPESGGSRVLVQFNHMDPGPITTEYFRFMVEQGIRSIGRKLPATDAFMDWGVFDPDGLKKAKEWLESKGCKDASATVL
jgi:hypothetical protein